MQTLFSRYGQFDFRWQRRRTLPLKAAPEYKQEHLHFPQVCAMTRYKQLLNDPIHDRIPGQARSAACQDLGKDPPPPHATRPVHFCVRNMGQETLEEEDIH